MSDSDEIVCLTETAFLDACAAHGFNGVIPHPGMVVKTFRKVKILFQPPAPPDPDQEPFRAWAKREGKPDFSLFAFGDLYLAWKDGRKYGEARSAKEIEDLRERLKVVAPPEPVRVRFAPTAARPFSIDGVSAILERELAAAKRKAWNDAIEAAAKVMSPCCKWSERNILALLKP